MLLKSKTVTQRRLLLTEGRSTVHSPRGPFQHIDAAAFLKNSPGRLSDIRLIGTLFLHGDSQPDDEPPTVLLEFILSMMKDKMGKTDL